VECPVYDAAHLKNLPDLDCIGNIKILCKIFLLSMEEIVTLLKSQKT